MQSRHHRPSSVLQKLIITEEGFFLSCCTCTFPIFWMRDVPWTRQNVNPFTGIFINVADSSQQTQAVKKQFAYIFIHLKSCVEKKNQRNRHSLFLQPIHFPQYSEYIDNRKNSYNSMYKRKPKMKPQSKRSFQQKRKSQKAMNNLHTSKSW